MDFFFRRKRKTLVWDVSEGIIWLTTNFFERMREERQRIEGGHFTPEFFFIMKPSLGFHTIFDSEHSRPAARNAKADLIFLYDERRPWKHGHDGCIPRATKLWII